MLNKNLSNAKNKSHLWVAFILYSILGLRFIRELEQGKETVRMDKMNVALSMFDMEALPWRKGE